MKRDLESQLIDWKNTKHRLPLLIRGARQVGKTYLVEAFGKTHFKATVTINFEFRPEFASCFDSFDPESIIQKIEILIDQTINTQHTLLFLDEIQECPQALMALRYFKEKMPEFAVIAAGSLLEFALENENLRMPVGRIKSLFLHPLSFNEYLSALGKHQKRTYIESISWETPPDPTIHSELLKDLRNYFLIGGMPAVINEYQDTKSLKACESMQSVIQTTYRQDFGKYAGKSRELLEILYQRIPRFIGQQIKYSKLGPETQSRTVKNALRLLQKARIISPIYHTPASGIPLGAIFKESVFKLLWMDVGLLQNASRLSLEIMQEANLTLINQGVLTEQFVGQELITAEPPEIDPQLYYWKRDKKSSQAEVDFVISIGSKIIPIEVKSGTTGRLKSLHMFLNEKKAGTGIQICQKPLSKQGSVWTIPLYLTSQIKRLLSYEN